MTDCPCGKPVHAQMLCQDCDDAPLPAALWEQAHTAAGLTDIYITLARLDARVTVLEQTIEERTADS